MADDKSRKVAIPAWQRTQQPLAVEPTKEAEESVASAAQPSDAATTTPVEPDTKTSSATTAKDLETEKSEAYTTDQIHKFLEDPAVKNAPIDKKSAFLIAKGISKDAVDQALETGHGVISLDVDEFKSMSREQTLPTQPTRDRDLPPVVTYPEFLIQPQKPPPLVTVGRLVNTAYIAGGLAAAFYGLSTFLISPMTDQLTEARHDFAQHADAHLLKLNERLASLVSNTPSAKTRGPDHEVPDSDAESITSDPTELYHRDMGTQTSPLPSRRASNSIAPSSAPPAEKTTTEKQEARLQIISSHLNELLKGETDNGNTNEGVQDRVNELRNYLDNLVYAPAGGVEGIWTPNGLGQKKRDDAIAALRTEIRGVKGVLLSAKRFPATGVPAAGRVGA